ncbi:hypothetical protein GDO81_018191 [Engystomops pustulosus]|uniref:Uncharacterized protein n=1 Tax=Engystomops pustulosus TaxID=76066 RepID=A0AAV7AA67_ENGPU|nr:hypothetical protein GDO81_018191 [Engystomops pustulosus]
MEAKSSVIKYHPSTPAPRSAPPSNVQKLRMNRTESYHANQRTHSCQSRGRRGETPQYHIITQEEEDSRNLIPANIRHKYGSSVVDQLISPEQVRSRLKEEGRTQHHQGYYIPRLRLNSIFMEDYPYKIYYELGYCLRSNLFPGAPIKQNSLVHDSYTAEVNEKGRLENYNPHHWHGRKTDDLAIWSEMLMKRKSIDKILQSQIKQSHVFPRHIHTHVPKDVPPVPPPQQPPKKTRKKRQQTKSEKPEEKPPSVPPPKEDDNFWDFYDKSIE